MCLAVPGKVETIDKTTSTARIDILGVKQDVAIDLVPQVDIGDYVLVHAGYAIEIIDEKYAQETLELYDEMPELL